jgi:hypothetical protein
MSYRDEIEKFLKEYPYRQMKVGKAFFRYVLAGDENKPCIVFLNGGMSMPIRFRWIWRRWSGRPHC